MNNIYLATESFNQSLTLTHVEQKMSMWYDRVYIGQQPFVKFIHQLNAFNVGKVSDIDTIFHQFTICLHALKNSMRKK